MTKESDYLTINRTTTGLRDFLFDEMERMANGQIDVERLKVMSKAGDTILKSAAIDITVRKMLINEARNGEPKAVADLNLNLILSDHTKA